MNIPICMTCGSTNVHGTNNEIPQLYCEDCKIIVWVIVLDSGSTYKVRKELSLPS